MYSTKEYKMWESSGKHAKKKLKKPITLTTIVTWQSRNTIKGEKIPVTESFHNWQIGMLHDASSEEAHTYLIQWKGGNNSNKKTNQSIIHITFIIEYSLRGIIPMTRCSFFNFAKMFKSKWHKLQILASKMGFHSWLIASQRNERTSQSEITTSGYILPF